jgi:hypothetical protein
MARKLRTHVGMRYPADAASLKALRRKGWSKRTEAERGAIAMKTVEPGGDCSDHPKGSQLNYLIASGQVEVVTAAPKKKTAKKPARS